MEDNPESIVNLEEVLHPLSEKWVLQVGLI